MGKQGERDIRVALLLELWPCSSAPGAALLQTAIPMVGADIDNHRDLGDDLVDQSYIQMGGRLQRIREAIDQQNSLLAGDHRPATDHGLFR